MIDYRQYIKVLEILKRTESTSHKGFLEEDTIEKKASAICDLFDTQKITTSGFVKPMTLQEQLQNAPRPIFTDGGNLPLDLNRVTCGCTDTKDCEGYA